MRNNCEISPSSSSSFTHMDGEQPTPLPGHTAHGCTEYHSESAPESQTTNRLAELNLMSATCCVARACCFHQGRCTYRHVCDGLSKYPPYVLLYCCLLATHTTGYVDMYSALGILSTQATPAAISIVRLPLPHNLPPPPGQSRAEREKNIQPGDFLSFFPSFSVPVL